LADLKIADLENPMIMDLMQDNDAKTKSREEKAKLLTAKLREAVKKAHSSQTDLTD